MVLPFYFAFQCPVIWVKANSAYATADVRSSCTTADVTYINTAVTGKEKQVVICPECGQKGSTE